MSFEDKLADLEKKAEFMKNELAKQGIKNPDKFINSPENVIKWMNEVEAKIAARSEITESLELAVSTLVNTKIASPEHEYIENLRIALFQVTSALVNVVEILKKKGIL